MRRRGARSPIPWLGALWLGGCAGAAVAHEPVVAIVLDDLGPGWRQGRRAVTLPGAVTCAFLPHTPHAQGLARLAHAEGKEVMLHLPMQPVDARPLGPGGLILDMTRAAFVRRLRDDLRAVPHVRGVNNHMGSLLTRHPGHMAWLMRELGRGRLYFVDSRTTAATVARRLARERGVRNTERDVFLDNRRSPGAIRAQLHALLAQARRRGTATAIGHPYPETLAVLETELPRLAGRGVRVVSVSRLIELQTRNPHLSPVPERRVAAGLRAGGGAGAASTRTVRSGGAL